MNKETLLTELLRRDDWVPQIASAAAVLVGTFARSGYSPEETLCIFYLATRGVEAAHPEARAFAVEFTERVRVVELEGEP